MGAIIGVINKKSNSINLSRNQRLIKYFESRFSNHSFLDQDVFCFGAFNAYISETSNYESLPYEDKESSLVITTDAILDNRDELLRQLNINQNKFEFIPDSRIILEAYKAWGNDSVKRLLGDFAFVIYNKTSGAVFMARDQVGKRQLYYYDNTDYFAFGTNLTSITNIIGEKCPLNDQWIVDYLSYDGVTHELDSSHTVFKDVMQILPANTLYYEKDGSIEINQYWLPEIDKVNKLSSVNEYTEGLKDIFTIAVKDRIKTDSNIGIMLSGGLDSGSVACIAASQLKESNKVLKAYSSIPYSNYVNNLRGNRNPDETEYIESIKQRHHNIEHTYCSCENENSITIIDSYIEMLEHPYKFVENSFWLDEITHLAAREGCGILLNGQFGNASVSYGYFVVHIKTLIKEKQYAKAIREIMYYSNFMDKPLWNETKRMLKIILPKSVLKALGKEQIYKENVPVNADLAKKYNVDERLKKCYEGKYADCLNDVYDMRRYFINPNLLSQIGELDTKFSLAYGIQIRDPSIDVRVIEYCYSIPYELYVIKGRERELIRMAMKNILPDEVRLNYKTRGLQSADWVQRLHPFMASIKEELNRLLKNDLVCYYLDVNKVKKTLVDLPEKISCYNREFRMLIVVMIFGRFIEAYESM